MNLFLATAAFSGYSQKSNIKEDVFINVTTDNLLVGETLQYAAFCLSKSTGKISPLSKYIYVELVGKEGVVYRQKLALDQGVGHGEFFLPSNLNTGRYYLLAYTRWMKNFGDYKKSHLIIVNPYEDHHNIVPSEIADVSMEFAPLTGEIIDGVKNKVAYQVKNYLENGLKNKGRLVDADGQQLQELFFDENGIGSFELTPEPNKAYQVIWNDLKDEFHFFDLPKAKKQGIGVYVEHSSDFLTIHLGVSSDVGAGQLRISHRDSTVFQKDIGRDSSPIKIDRKNLPADRLEIMISNTSGRVTSGYQLFNNTPKNNPVDTSFGRREGVSISEYLRAGKYSISVRGASTMEKTKHRGIYSGIEMDFSLIEPETVSFEDLENWAALFGKKESGTGLDEIRFLPEYQGELIQGKITSEDSTTLQGKSVMLSIPKTSLNLSSTLTDEKGNFLIEYESPEGDNLDSYLTVYDFNHQYDIVLEDNFLTSIPQLDFSGVHLDSSYVKEIVDRSIHSQIENAFYTPKAYVSTVSIFPVLRPSDFRLHYEWDDFTRFNTIKEHFVEYMVAAQVRENREHPLSVRPFFWELNFDNPPLIILDGVPVSGKAILEFSPYRIKSVDLFNNRFFLHNSVFDGVIAFNTIEGNMGGFTALRNTRRFSLIGASSAKRSLTNIKSEEIMDQKSPDRRIQLLWQPSFHVLEDGVQTVDFFTSDIEGDFELLIEGITEEGLPVSIVRKFRVKTSANEN